MRVLSVRQQYIADHSSTNYLFYAAEPLDRAARAVVSKLSSHVDVEEQTAQITYHGDFADLDDGRRQTFLKYYDVEVRESYDWWTLSVMLEKAKVAGIDFAGYTVEEEASLTFEEIGDRIRLRFEGAHLDYAVAGEDYDDDGMESIAELGLDLRDDLYAGLRDGLDVIKHYCEENALLPSKPHIGSNVGQRLRALLDPI
jgi:hypothetical protein